MKGNTTIYLNLQLSASNRNVKFEWSAPFNRTHGCRSCSSCDLFLYETVERPTHPSEDNRKSFLVERKLEEIWNPSSFPSPPYFYDNRRLVLMWGGLSLEEYSVWLFRIVFKSTDQSVLCLLVFFFLVPSCQEFYSFSITCLSYPRQRHKMLVGKTIWANYVQDQHKRYTVHRSEYKRCDIIG
jgi:hypothetical protein